MSAWSVQPFASGPQNTAGRFALYQEAMHFAFSKAIQTDKPWAIFGPDHELDAVIRPDGLGAEFRMIEE